MRMLHSINSRIPTILIIPIVVIVLAASIVLIVLWHRDKKKKLHMYRKHNHEHAADVPGGNILFVERSKCTDVRVGENNHHVYKQKESLKDILNNFDKDVIEESIIIVSNDGTGGVSLNSDFKLCGVRVERFDDEKNIIYIIPKKGFCITGKYWMRADAPTISELTDPESGTTFLSPIKHLSIYCTNAIRFGLITRKISIYLHLNLIPSNDD